MFKILKKIQFPKEANGMKSIANIKIARDLYYSSESKNVRFLLNKRFSWMNNVEGNIKVFYANYIEHIDTNVLSRYKLCNR